MNVLGLSYNYHDAAASVVRDGVPIAAAEEERFSRLKHDLSFPDRAIAYCLHEAGISAAELDAVAFYEKPARKLERALQIGKQYALVSIENVAAQFPTLIIQGMGAEDTVRDKLGFRGPVFFCEHHGSHAASAFYLSPFEEASILTVDGVGEWATCAEFTGQGSSIEKRREIYYPHSIGLFYSTLTAFLGFRVNDDEYKIMGLASYGKPCYRREFDKLIEIHGDGSFTLALEYFAYMYDSEKMYSTQMEGLLGKPRRNHEPIEERHMDIASSLQEVTEEVMVAMARSCRSNTASANLCLAGGVAYNCVANSKIVERSGFERVFIQPAAGDSGGAIGAALWASHEILNEPRYPIHFNPLLGPSFTEDQILNRLHAFEMKYIRLEEEDLCRRVAKLIHNNLILGWFQGRMEFGPRALGSRSILANPCAANMKDILNARVKFREEFRPFAPAVTEEASPTYFELEGASPFMLQTPRVRPDKAAQIPSVTHVDGTARVQTVSATGNPLFHRLIECFGDLSGVPILINTSFNIRGEPIVCTPDDAIKCFMGTDIDFLAIGPFLVSKD